MDGCRIRAYFKMKRIDDNMVKAATNSNINSTMEVTVNG